MENEGTISLGAEESQNPTRPLARRREEKDQERVQGGRKEKDPDSYVRHQARHSLVGILYLFFFCILIDKFYDQSRI